MAAIAQQPQAAAHVGFRLLCGLIAGRITFRLVLYGANIALLAGWGAQTYARYAAATGSLLWLVALAQAGPEKAALKLIPRDTPDRPAILATLRATIRVVPLALLLPAALAVAAAPDAAGSLYAVAAAQSIAIGLNMTAVAVQRATGAAGRELVNFGLLSSGWVMLTALAVAADVEPALYVLGLAAVTVAVTEVTMRGMTTSGFPRRSQLRSFGQTVLLMGAYDLAGMVAISLAFVVLPWTAYADQTGALYLALVGWGLVLSLIVYVARVFQPRLSIWLAHEGRGTGPLRALALARRTLWLNTVWLAVVAVIIIAADLRNLEPGAAAVLILTALLLCRGVIWSLMFASVSLLENGELRALRAVAHGAALGLLAVAVVSAAVVPVFGAAGAVWALAIDELVLAAVVLRRAR